MIRMIFMLLVVVMIILDGGIIVCGIRLRKQRFFLEKKSLKDKTVAMISTLSLIAIIEGIAMFFLGQTPIPIVYFILSHIAIMFAILVYYIGKYAGELSYIKKFNAKHEETKVGFGKVKGRDVDIKRKY